MFENRDIVQVFEINKQQTDIANMFFYLYTNVLFFYQLNCTTCININYAVISSSNIYLLLPLVFRRMNLIG